MNFSEVKSIDQIIVSENGAISFRESTRVLKDGEVIAQTFHRNSLYPGQSLDGIPESVAAIAAVVWTEEVLEAYAARVTAVTAPAEALNG